MKKTFLIGLFLFLVSNIPTQAQSMSSSYTTGLGIKMWGDGAGISLKHFVAPNRALEGIGYFWRGGTRITGLYEIHFDIANAEGLKWYIGPGAHVGFYNNRYNDRSYYNEWSSGSYVGLDGVLGLDYKFNGAPINLSIDWQPSFEFGDNRGFIGIWGGLGVRYTFN